MADTYTANYNLVKVEVGAHADTWGALLNTNFDLLDTAIKAVSTAVTGVDGDLSAYKPFPVGTRLAFPQAAAPLGWVQVTDDAANNRLLRVVPGAGAGLGGSHSPIVMNVVPAHTHGFTTSSVAAHNHGGNAGQMSVNAIHGHVAWTDVQGAHSHGGATGGVPGYTSRYLEYSVGGGAAAFGFTGAGNPSQPFNAHTHSIAADGTHSHNVGIGTTNIDHLHPISADGSHNHTATTDVGSSNTNWTPRYIDLIVAYLQ